MGCIADLHRLPRDNPIKGLTFNVLTMSLISGRLGILYAMILVGGALEFSGRGWLF
jgi:hypothetical protein